MSPKRILKGEKISKKLCTEYALERYSEGKSPLKNMKVGLLQRKGRQERPSTGKQLTWRLL